MVVYLPGAAADADAVTTPANMPGSVPSATITANRLMAITPSAPPPPPPRRAGGAATLACSSRRRPRRGGYEPACPRYHLLRAMSIPRYLGGSEAPTSPRGQPSTAAQCPARAAGRATPTGTPAPGGRRPVHLHFPGVSAEGAAAPPPRPNLLDAAP